jgi:hypothetical protein
LLDAGFFATGAAAAAAVVINRTAKTGQKLLIIKVLLLFLAYNYCRRAIATDEGRAFCPRSPLRAEQAYQELPELWNPPGG